MAEYIFKQPPYDELLRCLENDWHIHASWDGLRKFWCIELTEEDVRMRDARAERGTLTAEQVREAIEANSWAETSTIREFNDSSWQAIADELNARVERTCKLIRHGSLANMPSFVCWSCSECGFGWHHSENDKQFSFCPNCGARRVDA